MYAGHLYGNGRPKDNNSFLVLDISELQPAAYLIYTAAAGAAVSAAAYTAEGVAAHTGESETVEKTQWTEDELNALTIPQIEGLAAYMKYTVEGSNKAEKIASFLAAQTAAGRN